MLSQRTKPSFTSLAAFFLIVSPVVYVLSYAPVVRIYGGNEFILDEDIPWRPGNIGISVGPDYSFYQPVEQLTDNASIRPVMFWWAGLWGVRQHFEIVSFERDRGLPLRPFETFANVVSSSCRSNPDKQPSVQIHVEHHVQTP